MPPTRNKAPNATAEAIEAANGIAMANVPTTIRTIPSARIQPQFPRIASSS